MSELSLGRTDGVRTSSRIPLAAEYTPADLTRTEFDPAKDVGKAGSYPFTRGRRPGMYREQLWDMATYSGISSPTETNRRFRYIVSNNPGGGVRNTLTIALDLPSQVGIDPDHPDAYGEVGRSGVSIASLRDMAVVYDGIPLDRVRIATVANSMGNVAAAWFVALAIQRGYRLEDVVGNLQNDPFKEFTGRGTFIYPMAGHIRLALDVVEYCVQHLPHWKPMSVCGSQLRWGGATAVEEVAFAIAHAEAYLDGLLARGLDIREVLPLIEFHMVTDNEILEEASKFRALRRLWSRRVVERYRIPTDEVTMPHIQTYSAGYTMTAQQPMNNIVRIAMQVVAAALGGVDFIGTCSYDEAISTPTVEALQVALRTQQIVAHESGLATVVDPLGGSYFVESLTTELETRSIAVLDEIYRRGGPVKAIDSGWTNELIATFAYRFQQEVESGERVVVGVNAFQENVTTEEVEPQRIQEGIDEARAEAIQALRRERSTRAVLSSLATLREVARRGENTMSATIDVVLAEATIQEICDVFRDLYGAYEGGGQWTGPTSPEALVVAHK
jgi:methylmalonyl-CoA mutase N-terminal domain/subunit